MSGCGGGGSSADSKAARTVTEVDMIPSPSISMEPGDIVQLFAQTLNSNGGQVFTQTITFNSSNPAMQIGTQVGAQNGQALLCAGTWDNPSNPVVCHPFVYPSPLPNPPPVVASNITASAGGVTSATTVASIHIAVASVTVVPQITPPLLAVPPCVSEGKTQIYKAIAKDISGNDITATVGKFSWQSSQTSVATIPVGGDSGFDDQATATAVHPGDSNIIAQIGSVNPTTSTATVFEQCLVNSIDVSVGTPSATTTPPEDATHFTVATGATRALLVTVKDTTGADSDHTSRIELEHHPPRDSSRERHDTGANVAGVAAGTVGISASCLPNNCNIGTKANVTSNLVSGTVTGTPSTSATAYVTCTDPTAGSTCNTGTLAAPQVKLFPISGTTLGTAITLSHVPNSIAINPQNSKTIWVARRMATTRARD